MRRELSVAVAIVMLGGVLAVYAPSYFSLENLRDLFLVNAPVLLVALGTTLVILTGEIDVSAGSAFAVCSITAGVTAKLGLPTPLVIVTACLCGAVLGSLNGVLVAYARIPSIVVTLATMVAFRDGLRWLTQGAWIDALPQTFQWLGVSQTAFPIVVGVGVLGVVTCTGWTLQRLVMGRAVYATGSNSEGARLLGINPRLVKLCVFGVAGVLTGLGAIVNSTRFSQIPTNTGLGLEMKVIAAVVVGGVAITGGRGTITGTVLGVMLLGAVGPALTFLGVAAQWEHALQGAIILVAVALDAAPLANRRSASREASVGV
jgi:rhamnose transport system permease protein